MTGAVAVMAGMAGAAASFSVSASPSTVNGTYHGASGAAQNITTSATIASPSGGTAPFTYSWAQVGSSAYTWTIGSAATASTSFTATAVGKGEAASADFRVTVTDATGVVRTANVSANAFNESTA